MLIILTMSAGGLCFMRKEPIVTGEYYHIYSRGTDRRVTYIDDDDRERFVRGMIAFNDVGRERKSLARIRSQPSRSTTPLINMASYTLMPNHHHFLVRQRVDEGIGLFMQRLGAGYVCYFIRRHGRTGCLWESEYKAVRVETDAQLLHVSRYIHLNPLKLFFPDWKIKGVPNWEVAQRALLSYRWSSYAHFLGLTDDHAVNDRLLATLFEDAKEYEDFMRQWVMPDVRA